ncbi:MAG: glutamate formimidoyltransferase [Acidobacteria bacterium]|nr:glutamate formimidoyltransferase [Acidobacteriota bacterium]
MSPVVECVMNFSEGRDPKVIDQIAGAITSEPGVTLLDRQSDFDHHRSVISFIGAPAAVEEAAVRACGRAAEIIDLRRHRGEHPRIGATDVIPFVPLRAVTLQDCVAIARRAGERIARQFGIPVYLYGAAAARPDRENLENIRRGEFESLREEIVTQDTRIPDFGERRLHPTAGATAVGARDLLIAYNVYLDTEEVAVARQIASQVRSSSGGLPFVKALGLAAPARGHAQVSMNLVNYRQTPMHAAWDAVCKAAELLGTRAVSSEIVGLVPERALWAAAQHCLQIENFSEGLVIEHRVRESSTCITDERSEQYMQGLLPPRDAVLAEMETQAEKRSIPIVGPVVGRLLYQYARLIQARRIFEMGSAIGYSTIWWARAVGPGGCVHYTDGSREKAQEARRYFEQAGVADRVETRVGNSIDLIDAVAGEFDLIFVDVDKHQYPDAFRKAIPRLRPGGLLIADNVLWSGRVARGETDADSEGIREFNRLLYASRELLPVILPIRDGVAVAEKQWPGQGA